MCVCVCMCVCMYVCVIFYDSPKCLLVHSIERGNGTNSEAISMLIKEGKYPKNTNFYKRMHHLINTCVTRACVYVYMVYGKWTI